MTNTIEAEGLTKSFGQTRALRGVDLAAGPGTVMALLGPNGAGKTTAVRVLATLLKADAGQARICGYDVVTEAVQVRQLIALTGQFASVDDELTGSENLVMIGRLLGFSRATTGLDPRARIQVWETIRRVVAGGATVLLTTQYLEEADELADRIAVIDHGLVVADGTPAELKSRTGGQTLVVRAADRAETGRVAAIVADVTGTAPEISDETGLVTAPASNPALLPAVVRRLDQAGLMAAELAFRLPSLDEVFLTLTGHPAEDTPGSTESLIDDDGRAA
jgi:oleandomycin transport system ATP-binding protein